TTLRLKLESLKSTITDTTLSSSVDELQEIVKQLDSDVDFLAWQLRPMALDDLGLAAALGNYVKQWAEHFDVDAEFRAGDFKGDRLLPQVETNLYRIVQEALTNCAKHAKCSRAEILLERTDQHVVLIIEDNGVGFDTDAVPQHDSRWGLLGMRERGKLLSGTVEVESSPNQGTTIYVRIPLMNKTDEGSEDE
ncbi:MAG TPA: sensor histidine kinase, partial [Pyrinomonadaceae bacterium]